MRPFSILVVCTGNVCRSPAAERILAAELVGTGVKVSSAGTMALVGSDMEPPVRTMLDRLGDVDLALHSAKALTRDLIRHSGLLLAMAGNHKNWILEEAPRASRKVFTLRELASIIERVDPAAAPMPRWLEAVAAAAAPDAAIVTPGSPTDTKGRTGGQWHREPEARHRPPKSDAAGSAAPAPKLERPARLAHRMAEAVETLADLRSQFPAPTAGGGFDVTDPFRRPPEVYARMESELVPAARTVGRYLVRCATAAG